MNCPHCNQTQPEGYTGKKCFFCGQELSSDVVPAAPASAPFKLSWLWFWVGLMVPPILTMASAYFMRTLSANGGSNESVSVAVALIGAGAGGILCGIVIGTRVGKTQGARVASAIGLSILMSFVCFVLCFIGCNAGGYHFDIR